MKAQIAVKKYIVDTISIGPRTSYRPYHISSEKTTSWCSGPGDLPCGVGVEFTPKTGDSIPSRGARQRLLTKTGGRGVRSFVGSRGCFW